MTQVPRTVALAVAWMTTVALAASATPPGPTGTLRQASDPALTELLGRVGVWMEAFERDFAHVVAEERYVQLLKPWFAVPRSPADEPDLQWREDGRQGSRSGRNAPLERRQLRSDLLLVQTPGDRWLSYRDVFEVDGRTIRDRDERVKRLFLSAQASDHEQLRRVADESARYNLGGLVRNFNIPTFPLMAAHPRHQERFRFSRGKDEIVGGVVYAILLSRTFDTYLECLATYDDFRRLTVQTTEIVK